LRPKVEKYAVEGTKTLIVGNKSDLTTKRAVAYESGQELAESLGLGFVEASARSAQNVEIAFAKLIEQVLSSQPPRPSVTELGVPISTTSGMAPCAC